VWGQKGELSSSAQWTEMTRLILRSLTTFAVIAFSSATALGQDDDQQKSSKGGQMGVDLGVRAGYAVPAGEVAAGFAASDFIAGQVPLWLDVGGRIERHLVIGGYFSWGVGIAGDRISSGCDSTGSSCTLRDLRYGAQVSWHVSPGERSDFWFGLGLGLESLGLETQASSGFDAHESLSLVGLELPRLELGVDVPLSKYFVAGPFFASTREYTEAVLGEREPCTKALGSRHDTDPEHTSVNSMARTRRDPATLLPRCTVR
jgi:hypothetical protein